MRPNYATNIEVPVTIGCSITFIDLAFEKSWKVNIAAIEAAITTATKLISITSPHNPTGMLMKEEEIEQLIAVAESNNLILLVDETYRDACFKTPLPYHGTEKQECDQCFFFVKSFWLTRFKNGLAYYTAY